MIVKPYQVIIQMCPHLNACKIIWSPVYIKLWEWIVQFNYSKHICPVQWFLPKWIQKGKVENYTLFVYTTWSACDHTHVHYNHIRAKDWGRCAAHPNKRSWSDDSGNTGNTELGNLLNSVLVNWQGCQKIFIGSFI